MRESDGHWQEIWKTKPPDRVSWFEADPAT
jgi:hypothetical protein